MKILFCSQTRLVKELGGSKPLLELAEELEMLGWQCDTISPFDFNVDDSIAAKRCYAQNLRRHLHTHAGEYDVIDYDHATLPFPRAEFAAAPLFVARSVLLAHHYQTIPIPTGRSMRSRLGALLKGAKRQREKEAWICRAQITVEQSDLVNVSNEDDRVELIRRGIAAEKIVVLPFGISRSRRALFDAVSSDVPQQPLVAFVGTFEYRKGAREFPQIVAATVRAIPDVRFRLLGTAGLFPTREEVLAHFSSPLRERIEVVPQYRPEDLAGLLALCSVGIFPSYLEGFGFGVLEMLAASIPVIAYRCPGPSMMLPPEWFVPRGDAAALSAKVIALLQDPVQLQAMRVAAKQRSQPFNWAQIAQETSQAYQCAWARRA